MVKIDIHFASPFKLLVLTSTGQLFVQDSIDLGTQLVITCIRYESTVEW